MESTILAYANTQRQFSAQVRSKMEFYITVMVARSIRPESSNMLKWPKLMEFHSIYSRTQSLKNKPIQELQLTLQWILYSQKWDLPLVWLLGKAGSKASRWACLPLALLLNRWLKINGWLVKLLKAFSEKFSSTQEKSQRRTLGCLMMMEHSWLWKISTMVLGLLKMTTSSSSSGNQSTDLPSLTSIHKENKWLWNAKIQGGALWNLGH